MYPRFVSTYISQIVVIETKLLNPPEPFLDGFEINIEEMKLNKI